MFKRAPNVNTELVRLLKGFRATPSLVPQLYEQLFFGRFWALVEKRTEISDMAFLTYRTADGIQELPVFTEPEHFTLAKLARESAASTVEIDGFSLWPRMLDIVKTKQTEAAEDPGNSYAIRLNLQMIFTMVRVHGDNVQLPENT
jgi:hypothetical protein